jgi:hypothetical protein
MAQVRCSSGASQSFVAHRFENQCLIERWLGVEVERVEAFGLWKPRRPDAKMA